MFTLSDKQTRKCPVVDQQINLKQSCDSCRRMHGCEQQFCPLQADFAVEPIDFRIDVHRFKERV